MAGVQSPLPTQRGTGVTGWAGWVVFAGVMMFMIGAFHFVAGLVALFDDDYYVVGKNDLVLQVDYTAWGWTHLILGLVVAGAGFAVMTGATWGRIVGVILAGFSALANLAFLAADPVWGVLIIALDVVVIYALIVHGREVRNLD